MESFVLNVPIRSVRVAKTGSEENRVVSNLPPRSQQRLPIADSFVEEPSRDFETIDRAFFDAGVEYKYDGITKPNTIRLLKLLPGKPSEILRIELMEVSLDSDVEYEALSYQWGGSYTETTQKGPYIVETEFTFSHHILCHEKQMSITGNLHGVLLQMRSQTETRILWNDAICINQTDKVEKPKQLMLMGRIYSQAKIVLCWIGPEKKNTQNAFRIISKLAAAFKIKLDVTREAFLEGGSPMPDIVLDANVVEELRGPGWQAVMDVYTRDYFGRIWVVQEIVLSKNSVIICGSNQIPWKDFLNVSKLIASLGTNIYQKVDDLTAGLERREDDVDYVRHVKVERIVDQSDLNVVEFAKKWERVIWVGELQNAQGDKSRSLAFCLEKLRGHEVTREMDRIYGMLGMISTNSPYTTEHPIIPNYDQPIQLTFQEATEWSIRDLNSLKILDLCEGPATNVTPFLPTWVPDLSKGPAQCHDHEELHSPFALNKRLSRYYSVHFSHGIFSVQANILDTVVVARAPFTYGLKPIFMMQHFKENCYRELRKQDHIYPTGPSTLESFWRTLIGNTVLDSVEGKHSPFIPPSSFGKHFMKYNAIEFISNWGLPLQLTGKEPDLWDLRLNGAPFPLDEMFPEDVDNNISILALMAKQPFVRWMYECAKDPEGEQTKWAAQVNLRQWLCNGDYGRQYFFTKNGWMGIGHPCKVLKVGNGNVSTAEGSGVKVGDVVATLLGSEKVWVLRKDRDGVYVIVGQAYVHGLSEGTWFEVAKGQVWQTISIK